MALRCQALKKDAGQTQTHRQCLVVLHRDSNGVHISPVSGPGNSGSYSVKVLNRTTIKKKGLRSGLLLVGRRFLSRAGSNTSCSLEEHFKPSPEYSGSYSVQVLSRTTIKKKLLEVAWK